MPESDAPTTEGELRGQLAAARRTIAALQAGERERKIADERLLRQTSVFEGINKLFFHSVDATNVDEVARSCLSIVAELTGSSSGKISMLGEGGSLEELAAWPASAAGATMASAARDGDLAAVEAGRARVVKGLDGDHGGGTYLAIPVKEARRVIGVLGLAKAGEGHDAIDREVAETLAAAFAQALRRKRSEVQLQARAEETARLNQEIERNVEEARARQALIERQTAEILELSTPVMEIFDGVVVAPLVGSLSSERMARFNEALLARIVGAGATIAIVDITGVPTIDTSNAQQLVETIQAVRLVGARLILSGIRPAIAQTIVHLGLSLSGVDTQASLAVALRQSLSLVGHEISARTASGGGPAVLGGPEQPPSAE